MARKRNTAKFLFMEIVTNRTPLGLELGVQVRTEIAVVGKSLTAHGYYCSGH
jgi:hypothetical protein